MPLLILSVILFGLILLLEFAPGWFLLAFLLAVLADLLGAFRKRPSLLLTLLGLGALFSLFGDDDCGGDV